MARCNIRGSFTYKFLDGTEALLDYEVTIYDANDHRADKVEVCPAFGEDVSEESLEAEQERIDEQALDAAYENSQTEDKRKC